MFVWPIAEFTSLIRLSSSSIKCAKDCYCHKPTYFFDARSGHGLKERGIKAEHLSTAQASTSAQKKAESGQYEKDDRIYYANEQLQQHFNRHLFTICFNNFSQSMMMCNSVLLGFREHIFTRFVYSLAWFMSNLETICVTIGQRFLANPLS